MVEFDYQNGYPETDAADILDWKKFNADFFSTEQMVE